MIQFFFLLGNYLPDSQIVVGMSALASVFAACTFFAAPILGALSDRYGRKKILIISLLGSVIGYILFGIVGLFGLALGLGLIILSIHITSPVVVIAAVTSITLGEGLFDPSYNGRLSQSVDESSQGKLQGVNQSLQSVYRVLVPLAAAAIYSFSPGILYGVATCVMIGSLILFSKLQSQYVKN